MQSIDYVVIVTTHNILKVAPIGEALLEIHFIVVLFHFYHGMRLRHPMTLHDMTFHPPHPTTSPHQNGKQNKMLQNLIPKYKTQQIICS